MRTTIKATIASFVLVFSAVTAGLSTAQSYPSRPIRVIVPLAAGGQTDVVARMLTVKLAETFKQPLVVDNRTGGGGTIGTEIAVRANPDGYTILVASSTHAASAALYKLSYDAVNDVAPIAYIGQAAFMMSVHPSVPVKSAKELIAHDKANPGKLNYGSGGIGSTTHLATELFNQMAGARMAHVPYKGAAPALNDLIGGQIQFALLSMPIAIPQMKSNRVRGLAVTTANRSSATPDIPTVAETLPGYEAMSWFAVIGPKGLPQNIVRRWNSEVSRVLRLPDVKERMEGYGIEAVDGSPQFLREIIKRDIAKWQSVVKLTNIKPEG